MNVHHLELFYYVARHGGIMEAVRNIPYGIQQPAVSGQIAKLEEQLGRTLFHRRPFALTPEGEKLYQYIAPFFSGLDKLAIELGGSALRHIRIGASTTILREHLPGLLLGISRRYPDLKVSMREGYAAQLEECLLKDELDLVVTLIEGKPAAGLQSMKLIELPGVLIVPKDHPVKNPETLWAMDKITDPLICLPEGEPLCRNFQQWLRKKQVDWFPGIEASSLDLIEIYVAGGLGIGITLSVPGRTNSSKVRTLSLKDFPPTVIGALWRGPKTELIQTFLNEAKKVAKAIQ